MLQRRPHDYQQTCLPKKSLWEIFSEACHPEKTPSNAYISPEKSGVKTGPLNLSEFVDG